MLHYRQLFVLATTCLLLTTSGSAERLRYDIEPNHSTLGFSIPIFGGLTKVTGKFSEAEVTIYYDEADLSTAAVEAVLKVASIDTGIDMRDRDLQGEIFFDAANHPDITFRSTSVRREGDGWVAAGEFTMRGVTRTIELPFDLKVHTYDSGETMLGVSTSLTLDRNDYGVGSKFKHTTMENFLGTEVTVEIDLWTRSGKPVSDSGW